MAKGKWSTDELVQVDTSAVLAKYKELDLSQPEIKKSLKAAARKSLNIIRSSVRKGAATVTTNAEKRRKGVNLVVYKNASGGQVNVYKAFELSSGTGRRIFSLRWLEEGTKEGIGRDGRRHGATPPKPFFNASVSSAIGQAESEYTSHILESIEKVVAKRKQ